jgi:hypothetical protein
MIGLKGIHSFVSDPTLDKNQPRKYLEHVLITQMMSAWYWKKLNGPIHLYTTERDAEFLREMKMLDIYDHVDTELLSKTDDIPWDEFGPAVKMKVVSAQTEFPFATIDNDLIFRTVLENHEITDLTILHKEVFLNRNYPPVEYLGKREDYIFPEFLSKKVDPINVGFVIWNNRQLVRDYWNFAHDYMRENRGKSLTPEWAVPTLPKFWKSLFVEQRLLSALAERDNYRVHSLLPLKYSGDTGFWLSSKGEISDFNQTQKDTGIDFYHMWGEKSTYYNMEPPVCTGSQIFTFYNLIRAMNEIGDSQIQDSLDEIIVFTIQKTYALGLDDLYALRAANKFLIHDNISTPHV